MGMPHFVLLSCVGLFISAQAQDCSRPLGGSNMDLRDEDITKDTFPSGTKVRFVCDRGYQSQGSLGFVTCTTGNWSPLTMTCEKKSCGAIPEVLNGEINYPVGTEFGDTAIITCKVGFRLVGKGERKCDASGWIGRNPTCEVTTCGNPQKITNGTLLNPPDDEVPYRNVINYQCHKGLTMVGLGSITCMEDGQFHPGPPECRYVQCPEPKIEKGYLSGGSRPPHGYQATVTIVCNQGYKLNGHTNVVCGINSTWTPELPKCEAVTCPLPPSVTDGSFSPIKQIYQFGDIVEYSCSKDYEMTGQKTVLCSTTGAFEPAPPTCTQKQTTPRPAITTTTTASSTPSIIKPESGAPDSKVTIIIVVVLVLLVLVGFIVVVIYRRRARRESAAKVGVGKQVKDDEEAVSLS